uniref:DUF559 domain-containing protein n=1 Tax=Rhabditophanes sp. KR3021 TaxID=114890 RepID=A0AC35UGK7_9BILA
MEPAEELSEERTWAANFERITTEITFDEKCQIRYDFRCIRKKQFVGKGEMHAVLRFRDGRLMTTKQLEAAFYRKPLTVFRLDCLNIINRYVFENRQLIEGNTNAFDESRRGDIALFNNYTLSGRKLAYSREKSYPDLVGDPDKKGKRWPLSFDFLIGKDLLVEVDGAYHFKLPSRQNRAVKFERQQRYDKLKNKYCEDNGYHLIRISYSRAQEMSAILTHAIRR